MERLRRLGPAERPYSLLFLCLVLSLLSGVALLSVGMYGGLDLGGTLGNARPALTQMLATALGIGGAAVLSRIDYHVFLRRWPVLAAVCWGLVLLTFIPGVGYAPGGTGSRSWIAMPLGMSFQPTEIAKISFYITFAAHLAAVKETLNRPRTIVPVLAHMLLPVLVVHLQGDDGTALSFLAIGGVMLVMAGLNRWVVAVCAGAAGLAAPFVWSRLLSDYQRGRVLALMDPGRYADGIMYQQVQARIAIGEGGVWGKGFFGAEHHYVPRSENDFIFSYIAESVGFVGTVLLLGALALLLLGTLWAARAAADRAGSYLCIGVFATLLYQCVVNVGMNLMLLPVVGITLPFLSAGGTSVLMLYLAMGLVVSVCRFGRAPDRPKSPAEN